MKPTSIIPSPDFDLSEQRPSETATPVLISSKKSENFLIQTLRHNYPIFLLILVALLARFLTVPSFIESRDGLFFVRGLERYSVLEVRPHWPGYPVYLWFAMLWQVLLQTNPTQAFHVVSAFASSLTIWPIAALARDWLKSNGSNNQQAQLAGFGAGLTWALVPLSWIDGTEIFSDPFALLLALWMLWICWHSLELKAAQPNNIVSRWWLVGAAILAGLMLGVRLSYLVLLLPVAFVTWQHLKDKVKVGGFTIWFPLLVALGLGLPIVCWLGWQFMMDGWGFVQAGLDHLSGHYEDWGGSVTTDHQVLTRPVRLLETIVIHGVGGWWPSTGWFRLGATFGLLGLVSVGSWHLFKNPNRNPFILFILWLVPYGLWILLGNDVDLARYDFPFIALMCIVAGMGLPKIRQFFKYSRVVILGLVAVSLAIVTIPLAFDHQTDLPIGQKLVSYANQKLDQSQSVVLVYDDVPTLIFFLTDAAPHVQSNRASPSNLTAMIHTYESQKKNVYLTTTQTPDALSKDWMPVARLCRNPYLESRGPLEVWLYRYDVTANRSSDSALPSCSY